MTEPRVTILHVDDNEANRYIVTRILQNAGFNVLEAATGKAGLESVIRNQPALVVLDVRLPDSSGFEICRQIKANSETAFIPVLHLSASFIQSEDKAEGLDSGADAYLAQPVAPIELVATVRSLLRIRRAEEAALSSARDWQITFDSIRDGVCLLDEDGNFVRCNQAIVQLFHKSIHELLGCVHYEVMLAELGVGDGTCFRLARETHQRQVLELQSKDRWFAKTIDPIFNAQGTFTGAVFILSDITDRKQADAVLRESEARFRQMTDAAPMLVWMAGSDMRCSYFNQPWLDFTGRTLEQEMGNGWTEGIHPDDLERCLNTYTTACAAHQNFEMEYRLKRFDHQYRWLLDVGTPRFTPTGQFLGYIGSCVDIHDRKQAEILLRERNQRLDWLYETTRDLLSSNQPLMLISSLFEKLKEPLELDVYLNYLINDDCNQLHLASYGGISESVAQQIEWLEYGQAVCGTVAQQRDQIICATISISSDPKAELIRSLGITAYACQPLIAQGHLFGTLSFGSRRRHQFTDAEIELMQALCDQMAIALDRSRLLTSLQQQADELRQANRIKDEFLAVLSHELRSPLNPILGWARILQTTQQDEAKTQYALETIERNAKLQAQLVEDLLDVSRILRGKLSLNTGPVGLPFTIKAALETVRLAAEAKSIQIQVILEPNVGQVLGDSSRLQQVVWNLLFNAVKFTPPGGRVEVRLEQVGNEGVNGWTGGRVEENPSPHRPIHSYAQITVSDTGKGISPDFLPYVFDYFRQADGSTTRRFGGLGLGLAIVRHLVELHGGTIQADSAGEGQGATFTVKLPIMIAPKPNQDDTLSQAGSDFNFNGLQVLFVDDDRDSRELISFLLEQHGAKVIEVASASEALHSLEQAEFDLLISDVGMPDMDGYTLVQEVRTKASERSRTIPAIALTAYAGEIDQQQALAAGFQQHITKPVEPETLMRAIWTLVERDDRKPNA
ncbi:response regulator [Kovacikia minuta CCNUW1]|uniref:response regulator n=1 Tax=Kovacikia minuta TaxID=2931930 RepID=UPI001CCEF052|nr:response regulator [Kovacikia minuta]UBF23819.1 response regulator [Kovacikia minuta CCNUW1]